MKLGVAVVGALVITLLIWLSILWAGAPTPKPDGIPPGWSGPLPDAIFWASASAPKAGAMPPGWSGPLPDSTLWWFYVLLPGEPKATDTTIKLNFANEPICQEARRAMRYVLESLERLDLRVTECE